MLPYSFSDAEIEQQFRAFMDAHGVSPAPYETLILDGLLHRYDVSGDKRYSRNGAYIIHTDGLPAGFLQNWKLGIKENWAFDTSGLPQQQRDYFNSDDYRKQAEIIRQERERKILEAQLKAAEQARIFAETLKPADENHPCLLSDGNRLLVPLKDIDGNVKAVQWISPDGSKRFQNGAALSGLFWSIALDTVNPDDNNAVILLGEGFATMAKVYELTGKPSVAGIACGYLENVAKALKSKFPVARIICIADNDKATELTLKRNPGLHAANELKRNGLVLDVVAPEFDNPQDGSDWDDYALIHGDDYTSNVLRSRIQYAIIPQDVKIVLDKTTSINAQDLRAKVFPPVKWAVPGFLPEGLSILAGGPKVGKSILALHLSVGVAIGGCVLGGKYCTLPSKTHSAGFRNVSMAGSWPETRP